MARPPLVFASEVADEEAKIGMRARCARCGRWFFHDNCPHQTELATFNMTDDEAERVRARYAIGKIHNPDHDTTSYRDADYGHAD